MLWITVLTYPNNLIEFMDRFQTEADCREYLAKLRLKDGFTCPKCGGHRYWLTDRHHYRCPDCKHEMSLLAETIFQDSKLPLRTWFVAMWLLTTQKDGISAKSLQDNLGIRSYKSAWAMLQKLRTAMVRADREKLSGIVEVDETPIGGILEGGKRGRGSENKQLVAVAVQLESAVSGQCDDPIDPLRQYVLSKIRLRHIPDASKESCIGFVTESVQAKSHVITDGWVSYQGLQSAGYEHEVHVASHAKTEEEKLPHVHLVASLLDRWILGTHQGNIGESHLQAYLDEFTFRFNRKSSKHRGLLFYRLLEGAIGAQPATYDFIVENARHKI
jgi:transposase-like protein/DNA-directed RNA polymerase subunit RPC12/RpoP